MNLIWTGAEHDREGGRKEKRKIIIKFYIKLKNKKLSFKINNTVHTQKKTYLSLFKAMTS